MDRSVQTSGLPLADPVPSALVEPRPFIRQCHPAPFITRRTVHRLHRRLGHGRSCFAAFSGDVQGVPGRGGGPPATRKKQDRDGENGDRRQEELISHYVELSSLCPQFVRTFVRSPKSPETRMNTGFVVFVRSVAVISCFPGRRLCSAGAKKPPGHGTAGRLVLVLAAGGFELELAAEGHALRRGIGITSAPWRSLSR